MIGPILALGCALGTGAARADAAAWEAVGTTDGVHVWRRALPDSALLAFRGQAEVDVSADRLVRVLLDDARVPEWVDLMVAHEVLTLEADGDRLIYQSYDLPWPISDRDYVLWERPTLDAQTGVFTLTFSTTTAPSHPTRDGFVRAEVERTFWRITPLDADHARIEVEVNTDPKGAIPAWVVNLIQKDWPVNTVQGVVRQVEKADAVASSDR